MASKPIKTSTKAVDPLLLQIFSTGIRKGDRMKAEIIRHTIEHLAAEGLEGFSFDRVGKVVGISKSHVVYYFGEKEDIFEKCVEYITATAQRIVVEHVLDAETSLERLQAYIKGNFDWAKRFRSQASVFVLFYSQCLRKPRFSKLNAQIREASIARIGSILKEIHPSSSAEQILLRAHAILDLLTGALIEALTIDSKPKGSAWAKKFSRTEKMILALASSKLDMGSS